MQKAKMYGNKGEIKNIVKKLLKSYQVGKKLVKILKRSEEEDDRD
jgi:hypothetical protein